MAAKASITSTRLTDTIVCGAPGRVAALFAMRGGIAAMNAALCKICDEADDERAELAFVRSLDELMDIDRQILSLPATSLTDLKMQANVVRRRIAEDTLSDHEIEALLASIDQLVVAQ